MAIAVTTASGKLGRSIIEILKKSSLAEPVIGVARTPEKASGLGVEVRMGDYDNEEQLIASFRGVRTLMLIPGMAPPDDRIDQHRNVIRACLKNNVQKIVYASIIGADSGNGFAPIVQSNRTTERDIVESGVVWAIGRNGVYIDPDIDYIDHYQNAGEIVNCAGQGRCSYAARDELAHAYAALLGKDHYNGAVANLCGKAITQSELAKLLTMTFGPRLSYRDTDVKTFKQDRIQALGPFIGSVIGGIYEGIRQGTFDVASDFEGVTGRAHRSWEDYFSSLRVPNDAP
ncbi:MAG: NAD(P)H-binding protein [Pseudomonadota bacterium]